MNLIKLRAMLEKFYIEDIGDGDLSSMHLFPENEMGQMDIVAKMDGLFCGKQIIEECLRIVDNSSTVQCHFDDGENVFNGTVIATAKGNIQGLLTSERVLLNLIQRMSGIATATNEVAKIVKGTNTKICDTRKTMPGLRMLDKYAVRVGGGFNHRNGLYDAVMLKDNHIAFTGSITKAVKTVRENVGHTVAIEVEVETLLQVTDAVASHVDIIMFDNCTPTDIKKWRRVIPDSIITEASGMITKETIQDYASAGVDYISLGYLTHSVKAFDMSANVSTNSN